MNLYDVHAFMQVRVAARRIAATGPEAAIAAFEENEAVREAVSKTVDATGLEGPVSDVVFQHEEPSSGFTVDLVGRVGDPGFDPSGDPDETDWIVGADGTPKAVTGAQPTKDQLVLLHRCGHDDLVGRQWSAANIVQHLRMKGPVHAVHAAVLEAMEGLPRQDLLDLVHDLAADMASVRHGLARLDAPAGAAHALPLDRTAEFP